MPTPSSSTPLHPRSDRTRDSILRESSAGWANATSPLRIAKREPFSPPPSSSSSIPSTLDQMRPVARRSSNSYKHMFNSNLVSRSPFKAQLTPRQQPGDTNRVRQVVPVVRRASGEKRPRPDSLIQQAEHETAQRVNELGYKRRQSKGFQGLMKKEPVSKSPFRELLSPGRDAKASHKLSEDPRRKQDEDMHVPIAIAFPTKGDDSTSPETTETDSSLNSRASETRPRTPPMRPSPPPSRISPSPTTERRSPVPSAFQGSPARSSLVQKSRLLGPRSRSLSAGASGSTIADVPPPRRERRKTVTFDERCDVVEFDRDSCEDAVFDTDDEDVYGAPEAQSQSQETSPETSEYFDATELNDSINGLVESMLQEQQQATALSEPSTPETHTTSLSSIVSDVEMLAGGAEDGVPLGRTHHAERARAHRYDHDLLDTEPPLPAMFSAHTRDNAFSTPHHQESIEMQTPRATLTSTLPPDTEVQDGVPLGRTHHADRARAAREVEDVDVQMLPSSPSMTKTTHSTSAQQADGLLPEFDLGLSDIHTSSARGPGRGHKFSNDDVFRTTGEFAERTTEADFDQSEIDIEHPSNTLIARFHEFPPEVGHASYDYGSKRNDNSYQRTREVSLTGRSDNVSSDLQLREDQHGIQAHDSSLREDEKERTESDGTDRTAREPGQSGRRGSHEIHDEAMRLASPVGQHTADFEPPLPRHQGLYAQPVTGSSNSFVGSDGRRSMSPRINREDVVRKLTRQRSNENHSPLGTPPLASSVSSMPRVIEAAETEQVKMDDVLAHLPPPPSQIDDDVPQARPSLGERLKRAFSPSLQAPAPVRPPVIPAASSSQPPSPSALSYGSSAPPPLAKEPPHRESPVSSPPRVGRQGRAYTYDFDERPPLSAAKIIPRGSPVSSSFDFSQPGVDIGEMDMRSALDRLVDDVSVANGVEPAAASAGAGINVDSAALDADVSMTDTELITEESTELLANLRESVRERPQLQRAGTAPAPALPTTPTPERPPMARSVSEVSMMGPSSAAAMHQHQQNMFGEPSLAPPHDDAPPLPPKTPQKSARQEREEMIKEKRKEARARESGEYFVPPRRDAAGNLLETSPAGKRRSGGRPSMGRSMSTGDVEDAASEDPTVPSAQRRVSVLRRRKGGVLGVRLEEDDDMLSDSIQRELRGRDGPKKTYELKEYEAVVYASSSQEASAAQANQFPDIEDKAWRTVRRPSDMDEYAREIKAIRAQEKPGKTHGKVFVKVLQIKGFSVPLPPQQTFFTLTLNNGIHYVTTPVCRLSREARIDQEFELIEHGKLEFSLTINVRRDPHVIQLFKAIALPPLRAPQQAAPSPPPRGVRSFFGGTPKKPKAPKHDRSQTEPVVRIELEENLARYMKQDGTLARAFIVFREVAGRCDTKLMESTFPLIGQRLESPGEGGGAGGGMVPKQIGEILLQIFRLPPLPGIPPNQLPQSLDECHRGLSNVRFHKQTYYEGILTQLGGDCSTWRRRQLRIIGGNLIAFSDVTKRAMAAIDLKKAIAIEDDQDPANVSKHRDVDDYDNVYGVERSFRLIFPQKQEIAFFADTEEEKTGWLNILRSLVGRIPPHHLWAELCWQRLTEQKSVQASSPPPTSPVNAISNAGDNLRKQR